MDWEIRIAELCPAIDSCAPHEFVATMNAIANGRPEDDPAGMFERASSLDSTG